MSFLNLLKNEKKYSIQESIEKAPEISIISEEKNDGNAENILRKAGYKIKLITPTSFGTQITFAKAYDPKEIQELLKNFTVKTKGSKDIFVVD